MAAFETTSAARGSFFSFVSAQFDLVLERVAQYRTYRKALDELQSLDARELADIGLTRGDVRRLAREAAGYAPK